MTKHASATISFRCTAAEHASIAARSADHGVTASAYMRTCIERIERQQLDIAAICEAFRSTSALIGKRASSFSPDLQLTHRLQLVIPEHLSHYVAAAGASNGRKVGLVYRAIMHRAKVEDWTPPAVTRATRGAVAVSVPRAFVDRLGQVTSATIGTDDLVALLQVGILRELIRHNLPGRHEYNDYSSQAIRKLSHLFYGVPREIEHETFDVKPQAEMITFDFVDTQDGARHLGRIMGIGAMPVGTLLGCIATLTIAETAGTRLPAKLRGSTNAEHRTD